MMSPNELYPEEFIAGLSEAVNDVREGNITEVKTFEDFIS